MNPLVLILTLLFLALVQAIKEIVMFTVHHFYGVLLVVAPLAMLWLVALMVHSK